MFKTGDQIGPYTIVRNLGAGAMGEVYLGHHRHMGRDAAIKVLRAELTEDAEVVNRFFTEARATATARHPGIVEIFDCDVHRTGRAFIVMEYLRGEDLARRLERLGGAAGELAVTLALARQIAEALGAAHAVGIVHRDLKPGNIFLEGEIGFGIPVVKIVDFGIAKLLQPEGVGHDQTRTGRILGTPLYMSPEQAKGAKKIDQRTDVYALGCVLFEMLAGRPPFVRKGPAEVIVAHLHEPAPRVSSVAAGIPAPLDALVAAMLAKAPDERPASMSEVVARLGDVVAGFAPSRVATQLLPGGRPAGGSQTREPVAPPSVAAVSTPPSAPAPQPAAREASRSETGRRPARVFARAATTTLGNSAAELVAASDGDDPASARRRAFALGAAALVVVGAVFAWQLARSGARSSATPPPSVAPLPPAAPPVSPTSAPETPAPEASASETKPVPAGAAAKPPKPAHHHERSRHTSEFKAIEDQ